MQTQLQKGTGTCPHALIQSHNIQRRPQGWFGIQCDLLSCTLDSTDQCCSLLSSKVECTRPGTLLMYQDSRPSAFNHAKQRADPMAQQGTEPCCATSCHACEAVPDLVPHTVLILSFHLCQWGSLQVTDQATNIDLDHSGYPRQNEGVCTLLAFISVMVGY